MRQFLALIIITLVLTGFDAAMHLFGASLIEPAKQMSSMDCCPDKHEKGETMDMKCHYCCAAVIGMQDGVISVQSLSYVQLLHLRSSP